MIRAWWHAVAIGTLLIAGDLARARRRRRASSHGHRRNRRRKAAPPLRTPWGDPDLTGIWNNATSTPLQRPAADGKPVLTDEEAAEFAAELAYGLTRDRRDGGAEPTSTARTTNTGWIRSVWKSRPTGGRR